MISSVAESYQIHPQTLRLYERLGLLTPSRSDGNTRLYTEEDLQRLEVILTLTRELGVNLAGVEVILNMREKMEQLQKQVEEMIEFRARAGFSFSGGFASECYRARAGRQNREVFPMRLMRFANFLWLRHAAVLCATGGRGDKAPVYTQSYAILIKGELAGTENVTETVNEAGDILSASEHEIYVSDGLGTKRMAFTTKMHLAKNTYAPVFYSYKYTSGDASDSYEVDVKGTLIRRTLTRNGRTSEVTASVQPNTVILDFNVYHQYDYLVRRYDAVKGGRQIFSDFVPLIGNDIQLALTLMGDTELKYEKGSLWQ